MKFSQFLALQKHIESSFSLGQNPRVYLIVHSQREERKRLLEKVAQKLEGLTKAEVRCIEGGGWNDVHALVATPSLFGGEEIFSWNAGKDLSEEVLPRIRKYVDNPSPSSYLLIGAEPSKAFSQFYTETKKHLIFLDASEEKPWEKDKRLQQEVLQAVKDAGKTIAPSALSYLLEIGGGVSGILESELSKVLLYVGEKTQITEADVKRIGAPSAGSIGWQVAEDLIWEGKLPSQDRDLSFVLGFLGQLRFLLQQARQVGWHLREKKEPEEILKLMNLRQPQLEKIKQRIQKNGLVYLEKSLESIFQIELLSKSSNHHPEVLLELLQIKLNHLRRNHVR